MDTRRYMLFLFLSMVILIGWTRLVIPYLSPEAVQKPQPPAAAQADGAKKEDAPAPADQAAEAPAQDVAEPDDAEVAETPADQPPPVNPQAQNPRRTIQLGTLDPNSPYFMQAEIVSQGAAVRSIALNDPRYTEAKDRKKPLKVVGSTGSDLETFETTVAIVNKKQDTPIEKQLEAASSNLRTADWAVVETTRDPDSPADKPIYTAVTLSYRAPDGSFEVRKRYFLEKVQMAQGDPEHIRDSSPVGYQLFMNLTVKNLARQTRHLAYELQGPVGVPLENIDSTYRFRDVKVGFLNAEEANLELDRRGIEPKTMTAKEIVQAVEEAQAGPVEADKLHWERPLHYIGVDVQYFAALVLPLDDQLANPYIQVAEPMLVGKAPVEKQAEISVRLVSRSVELAPGAEFTDRYSLFAGPKRQAVLAPLRADKVIDFGYFGFVSKPLLDLLKFFHDWLGMPYWLAIITLTVMVRGAMFPLSRKQAQSAKKMKELQPKIAELKKKYANDREKLGRAQMELFSKHNYNPLAGCLPLVIQMPIFFGLYSALGNAVDLRMARFLYIDNLAAPDSLFTLPFALPILGSSFNLLPILTVTLFVAQQKMFMPPPADEQQELQYKMMNFMMIFMGFMFYHVPAGLCLYFIASSLWGMSERKLLELTSKSESVSEELRAKAEPPKKPDQPGAIQRFWERLLASAEAATEQRSNGRSEQKRARSGKGKRKSKLR